VCLFCSLFIANCFALSLGAVRTTYKRPSMNIFTQANDDAATMQTIRDNLGKDKLFIETAYPHVVKNLVLRWGTPEFDDYIQTLIVTDRDNRQGFAFEAIRELLALDIAHSQSFVFN
jgi:hypothetical protein